MKMMVENISKKVAVQFLSDGKLAKWEDLEDLKFHKSFFFD